MRAFVSIELPENIRLNIFKSFKQLKNSGFVVGNFTKKENLHLTLKFLDNLSKRQKEKVEQILSSINFRKFPIETGEVGFFPDDKKPRILWVKLIAYDIEDLKNVIENNLEKIGIPKEKKEFSSHVTIARIKKIKNKTGFFQKLKEVTPSKMFFIAQEFSLVKSVLTPKGPKYSVLRDFNLLYRS